MDTKSADESLSNDEEKRSMTLDAALKEIGFGIFNVGVIILCGFAIACVFMETVSINVILPLAACDLNLSDSDKGLLSGIGKVGVIASTYVWGYLADTRGRKFVTVIPLLIAGSFSVMSSFANSFWVLMVLRLLNGVFISGPSACVFAYVVEFHSVKMRSKVMMMSSVAYSIIVYWYPATAAIFLNQDWSFHIDFLGIDYKPWRLFFIISSLPTIVCSICTIFCIPESPKFTFAKGDEAETLKILKYAHAKNNGEGKFKIESLHKDSEYGKLKNSLNKNPVKAMWKQTVPIFKNSLKDITRASFLQFTLYFVSTGYWAFFPHLSQKLGDKMSSDRPSSQTLCEIYNQRDKAGRDCLNKYDPGTFINIFVLNTVYSVGSIIISYTIDKFGKKISINVVLLICGLSSILLMFIQVPALANVLYVTLLSCGLAGSVVHASTAELFPTQYRAMALSISLFFGRFGGTVGAVFLGSLIADYCTLTFLVPAVMFGIAAALVWKLPKPADEITR